MEHTHAHTHEHSHPGPKTYFAVLIGLLILTVITVLAAGFDFGSLNIVIALLIASVKGSLVALFFMHLKNDRFNAVVFCTGLIFLAVFLSFTLFDIDTRRYVLPGNLKEPVLEFPGAPLGKPIQPSTGTAIVPDATPAAGTAPAPTAAPAPAPAGGPPPSGAGH